MEMKTNEPFLDYLRVIDLGAIRAADISDADLGASRRYPDCEMTRQRSIVELAYGNSNRVGLLTFPRDICPMEGSSRNDRPVRTVVPILW